MKQRDIKTKETYRISFQLEGPAIAATYLPIARPSAPGILRKQLEFQGACQRHNPNRDLCRLPSQALLFVYTSSATPKPVPGALTQKRL